jgi:prepilin-type N-terminal cleavage/methylation domain-containing protein
MSARLLKSVSRPAAPKLKAKAGFDAGYSLVELLVTMALTGIVLGMSVGFYPQAVNIVRGDADMRIVYWEMKLARDTAISQRRYVEVRFTAPNMITSVRRNIPGGTTVLSTAVLEHNTQFVLFAGQPDTPDAFGRVTATYFNGAVLPVMFTPDGMLTDTNGNTVNGTVFLGQPGKPVTSRALTVFGPTATLRTYRWNGAAWRH